MLWVMRKRAEALLQWYLTHSRLVRLPQQLRGFQMGLGDPVLRLLGAAQTALLEQLSAA